VATLVFGAVGTGIAVVGTRKNKDKDGAVAPGSGTYSELAVDAGDVAIVGSDHPGPTKPEVVVDAAPSTNPVGKSDDEKTQKANKCVELQAAKNWQELVDCAKGLEALGDKDKAASFKKRAVVEQANELKAKDVGAALRDHNLKPAESLLAKIGDDSVYYKSLHDHFLEEENNAVEEARRRAQGFANAHDCPALKRYVAQLSAGTARVVAAVQAVKCAEKNPAPDPGIKPPTGSSSAVPSAGKSACETTNVDELIGQAATQYSDGHAGTALDLMTKALGCRQNVQMYRFAATYACAAHDFKRAKIYFAKVPPQYQAGIEQKCQQEGVPLR